MPRNSGARKMRILALTVSIRASSGAADSQLEHQRGQRQRRAQASLTPCGDAPGEEQRDADAGVGEQLQAAAHSISARWRPEYSRIIASWIMVSSRWVVGLSTGMRAFSASDTMVKATPAKARLGIDDELVVGQRLDDGGQRGGVGDQRRR